MEKCLMVNNLRRWTFQWTLKASKGVGGGGGGGGGLMEVCRNTCKPFHKKINNSKYITVSCT